MIPEENYVFMGASSDRGHTMTSQKEIEQALFGKSPLDKGKDTAVAKFQKPVKKSSIVFKHIVLELGDPEDSALFNDLLNKRRYNIIMFDKSWTKDGDLKAFVLYQENLDIKDEEENNAK